MHYTIENTEEDENAQGEREGIARWGGRRGPASGGSARGARAGAEGPRSFKSLRRRELRFRGSRVSCRASCRPHPQRLVWCLGRAGALTSADGSPCLPGTHTARERALNWQPVSDAACGPRPCSVDCAHGVHDQRLRPRATGSRCGTRTASLRRSPTPPPLTNKWVASSSRHCAGCILAIAALMLY